MLRFSFGTLATDKTVQLSRWDKVLFLLDSQFQRGGMVERCVTHGLAFGRCTLGIKRKFLHCELMQCVHLSHLHGWYIASTGYYLFPSAQKRLAVSGVCPPLCRLQKTRQYPGVSLIINLCFIFFPLGSPQMCLCHLENYGPNSQNLCCSFLFRSNETLGFWILCVCGTFFVRVIFGC